MSPAGTPIVNLISYFGTARDDLHPALIRLPSQGSSLACVLSRSPL